MSEQLTVAIAMELSWRYASGQAMERFCRGLAQRRIEAIACQHCGRRYLPPRPVCGDCHLPMETWVPGGHTRLLAAVSGAHRRALHGRTGAPRPVPYGMGLIRLDGADTTVNHYLAQADTATLRIGQRVRAVWRSELRGSMDDIEHFEVLP